VSIFIKVFAELFSKSDYSLFYLLASSIATATATCHQSNRAGYSYHGVVTCADHTHHLYASGALAIASGWKALAQKPCRISLFDIFALQNLYSLNTSF